jgi:NAD(P)-dependent dehydrogenase (short-subunit alcohol dehydrogenase family)
MAGILEGRVALVTGAASGIGRATALVFADEGAKLLLADVDETGGGETVRLAGERGAEASFVECDVSDSAQVEALVEGCIARFGRLDCAFNNAGIGGQSARLQMVAQGGGAIVNAASLVGVMGYPNLGAYNAAKHGVVGLTRTAALEYASSGIRVNAVCPGWIETPMVMDSGPQPASIPAVYDALAGLMPLGRLGKPEEVAAAVAWLCSDAASFVTGHPLLVDGGALAGRQRAEDALREPG